MRHDLRWEPDAVFKNAERAVIRAEGKVFCTAALEALAFNQRRQWEFVLRDEVARFLEGRSHNLVRHDPEGEPDVWTRPGML